MTAVEGALSPKSLHPLRVRNFRLLWIGESISLLGDQFYFIALPWLVLQLTEDPLVLGAVMALGSIPRAIFMIVGGALVDRLSPRSVMIASNLARMLLVALLALLVLTNTLQLWMLYLFAVVFGIASAFYIPAQSAIIPALLKSDQLQAGNTLTLGVSTLSMFVGPALAGIAIALLSGSQPDQEAPGLTGIGIAFALDAFSFLVSLITLWQIQAQKAIPSATEARSVFASIREGMAYVWASPVLRMIFIQLLGLNIFMSGPIDVGVPLLAKRNLPEGAAAFGVVMSAYGGGWLLGIVLANILPKPRPARFGFALLSGLTVLGIGMILLPLSNSTPLIALIMLCIGTGMGYTNINFTTWTQRRIPEALMGRVMSLIMFTSVGMFPISVALASAVLNINLVLMFVGSGVLMTAMTLYYATLPMARQIGLEVEEIEKQRLESHSRQ